MPVCVRRHARAADGRAGREPPGRAAAALAFKPRPSPCRRGGWRECCSGGSLSVGGPAAPNPPFAQAGESPPGRAALPRNPMRGCVTHFQVICYTFLGGDVAVVATARIGVSVCPQVLGGHEPPKPSPRGQPPARVGRAGPVWLAAGGVVEDAKDTVLLSMSRWKSFLERKSFIRENGVGRGGRARDGRPTGAADCGTGARWVAYPPGGR